MMPGTIAERCVENVTAPEAVSSVDVSGLTSAERTVALYASDMPTRRRYGTKEQVRAWIAQGAERLGREELRQSALFFNGHFRLALSDLVPAAVQARYDERYPDTLRMDVAARATATSKCFDGMSDAARYRNSMARVEGECPCCGTGRIECVSEDFDPDLSYELECPVHASRRRSSASWVRGGH